MSARLTAAEIRATYPTPTVCPKSPVSHIARQSSQPRRSSKTYCVGGALCLMVYDPGHVRSCFPVVGVIAEVLYEVNPEIFLLQAEAFARKIVALNDRARFDEAWAALDEALAYPLEPSDADLRDSVFLREQAD